MKKRGQITVFMIAALFILLAVGIFYYSAGSDSESKSGITVTKSLDSAKADIVKSYAESCLKSSSEEGLFRIGLHGGYIAPEGSIKYGDEGILNPGANILVLADETIVPVYVNGNNNNIPIENAVKTKLAKYIAFELQRCVETGSFADIGLIVAKPQLSHESITITFNDEDVFVSANYPLTVKSGNEQSLLDSFNTVLPIRFKKIYDTAAEIANDIIAPGDFDVSSKCTSYDKNGLTNVYTIGTGTNKIVQIVDFSTYQNNYFNSYVFQFGIKDSNVAGRCVII